jgi:hypothetical protein
MHSSTAFFPARFVCLRADCPIHLESVIPAYRVMTWLVGS